MNPKFIFTNGKTFANIERTPAISRLVMDFFLLPEIIDMDIRWRIQPAIYNRAISNSNRSQSVETIMIRAYNKVTGEPIESNIFDKLETIVSDGLAREFWESSHFR